jgi:glycosyltransferase involved in cell wall biosynthesis
MPSTRSDEPFVSVLTPVYNGEPYLAECVESVLAQAYENWEYVIVDNCSTDATFEIAQRYAERDGRIRVFRSTQHVGVIANHNLAFRNMPVDAKYCKVVQADDLLFPECVSRMVAVAESHPSVGIVASYSLLGAKVRGDGIPYPTEVVPGREICRGVLFGDFNVLLRPTTLLFRADFVRGTTRFFNEAHLHADLEVGFEVLRHSDLGFVHQVLSYCRAHDGSVSATTAARFNSYAPAWLDILQRYGSIYLSREEHEKLFATALGDYYGFLARSLYQRREKPFWEFHRRELLRIGHPLSTPKLIMTAIGLAWGVFSNPMKALRRSLRPWPSA